MALKTLAASHQAPVGTAPGCRRLLRSITAPAVTLPSYAMMILQGEVLGDVGATCLIWGAARIIETPR